MQEHRLRSKDSGGCIRVLPPCRPKKGVMLLMIGFVLFTLTLMRGSFLSEAIFGQPFKFTHHMVLAVLVWVVYAVLPAGRWCLGWYGQ